ncbi:MAG: efflux RND transporter periplasmic adaptor subunit [Bacteriovoracaceae bacterium]
MNIVIKAYFMKSLIITLSILLALILSSCGKSSSTHQGHTDSTSTEQIVDYYTCPMHPQVKSDTPGVCPICTMDLVKASNSRKMEASSDESLIPLNDRDQILANVSSVVVGFEPIEHTVRSFGTLEIPEPNKTIISARFNGRIEKLFVNAVGAKVKKGQPLFDVYSPDIVQAENEYRQAYTSNSQTRNNFLTIAKSKLQLLGLTENQIQALETQETVPLVITYHSPASGIIIDKKIVEGIYVAEGTSLYDVSDVSTLWNIADVYESDAAHIRVGERAELSIASYPDQTFPASVSLIYPVVNPQSRTVKVRLTVNNAAEKLKPNMYTETVFQRKKGKSLTVPVSAVLITGKRNLVYIKAEHENHFEAREIGIGTRFNGKYEVTWGLIEGEEVVSEGGYLIDSESQLKTGSGSGHQHGGATSNETTKEKPAEKHTH